MNRNNLALVDEQQLTQAKGMITPAGTIEDALDQFNLYVKLKQKLGKPEDFQTFWAKEKQSNGKYEFKEKAFPKKSFVRKVQRFFNISCEILREEGLKDEHGKIFAWIVTARAVHQGTGAYQDGDGACSYEEKIEKQKGASTTFHNIRAHAVTRAKNRAILDLVGFGDVSAEELPLNSKEGEPSLEEERIKKGRQMVVIVSEKNKGLTKEERKMLVKSETGKDSLTKLTLDELGRMYKYFNSHTSEDLKETAKALQIAENVEINVIDVDPETGEVKVT